MGQGLACLHAMCHWQSDAWGCALRCLHVDWALQIHTCKPAD